MTITSKHLALLRHAKSSWSDDRLHDHARPLNHRGERAAARMGAYLRDEGIEPDLVLCSSARRTRLTLDLLDLAVGGEVRTEDELYGADAISLLDRLRLVGDDVGSVLVIGHNPGIHDLACLLMNDSDELAAGFPTAALADLRVPVATWREVRPGIAMLHAFVVPRQLE